ncbi:hypothetical protein THAOC_02624 [Thalassiosira oceanica]|uniref:Sm domain-containing protein n=1 Tax=Thalassiosira oceanica TaxID=159749 RepID=K0TEZ1_THAOC|nr:hypothetical protein THAOC_02624 [Thalassiosira oceanica]|eukprot:EJK75649.1 hypothetical protein THAOC_02624 [Thalassiosira oceanica]
MQTAGRLIQLSYLLRAFTFAWRSSRPAHRPIIASDPSLGGHRRGSFEGALAENHSAMSAKGGRGSGGGKRDSILELAKLIDQNVRVKCLGGRELRGALRGYDELVNLVLDDCDEFIRGWLGVETRISGYSNDPEKITNKTRKLGLVVIRGTQVSLVSPEDGTEEIANPFLDGGEEDGEDEQEEE